MASSDLMNFIEDRTGDMDRGTARYDGESTGVVYLRDDLREQRIQSEIDRKLNRVRTEATSKEE